MGADTESVTQRGGAHQMNFPTSIDVSGRSVPVVVSEFPATEAPMFGVIARLAQLGGLDTEPSWTVVFTGSEGNECRQGRDQYARYDASRAVAFARTLEFNRIPVLRFEVTSYR
jgi:purine nucleoside permease